MPIINVPGVGQVNFPDSMSDKEIVEAIERDILKTKKAKEVSLKETVADIPKALGRGAVGLLETAGIGASAALPEEYEEKARKGIESLAAPAREYLAPATPEIAETVPSKLAAGLGSTLPFFALGPAGIAGRAIAGGLGVSAGAGEARRGAELAGATAEDRRLATVLGAPTGLLDIIAPNIGPLKTMFTTALARGGVEGITEAAQNVAQNLIARGVYDPKRDVLEGTAEEGAYGAGVGALASLMVDMAFGRRAYAPKAAPEAAAPQGAPVSPVAAPEIATVAPPSGFSAEEAANLRAQAEEAEQARLAGIAEAEREQMAAAQEFARGMPGLTGAPGMNVQMMDAVRQRQAEEAAAAEAQRQAEAKQAEAQRQAQIKEIEGTTFSADPVMDRLTKDRMLANLQVPLATVASKNQLQTKPELNYFEQQDAIRRAEEADVRKGMRPLKERATRLAPEELEQMGFPPKEKKPAKMKPAENPDNLGFMGFDQAGDPILDLVATGAKPFPKRSEAEQAKTFVPDTKIIKVPNGFVLSPKTDEDFAREAQAGKRLGQFQSGKEKGMPTAAHEFIIERGGLRKDQQRNTDFPDENPRVGNRVLFKPQGMTLAEAAEKLYEAGYIDEETETKAQDAISKSIKGNRVYTPEGYDRASEIERQKAEIAAARAEPPYLPEEDIYDRMYSDDFFRQPMEEVRRIAEENSLDFSGIAEEVYSRLPQDVTQAQYDDAVRQAVSGAIRNRPQSGSISETLAQEGGVKGNNPTKEGIAFQQQLQGKTFDQALDWMVANAPTRFNKLVAQKIKAVANALQQRGVQINFEIQGGDRRDSRLYAARGVTSFTWRDDGTSINILLNGEPVIKDQNGYASGMNYGTLQHEFLHVTTRSATRFLPANDPIKKELNDLFNKVVVEFNKQAKEGSLPPLLKDYYRRLNNVLASPDELMSWGITDRDFQNWLDTINVGPKQTAFNKLVSLIRDLIGLSKPFETALERLVRTTDSMLTMDVDVVGKAMERQGYSFGKPVAKPVGKMQQQELFRGSQRMARDTLAVRKGGFYFDAKDSPLYQTRTAEEVGDFSQAEADKVVDLDKRARDIQAERRWVGKLKDGAWIGARLDLGTYKAAKPRGLPPVLSLHEGKESLHTRAGFSKGELLKLVPHVTLKNVRFNVFQGERERIAAGGEKGRMASADGQYMDVPPNFDGIEVSFNPTREHLFRDALGRAVKYADEVTVLKNRMYARGNIEYYGAEDVPPVPTKPSDSWIMASGQDARQLQERPAIVDEGNKVSKEQQQNLFNGQNIIQDTLFSRRAGFFIDARQSPLYQRRNAGQVPVITQEMANRALATHSKGARVEGKGIQLKPGDYIGARLDLPIRASSRDIMPGGVPLQAIHMGNASNHARDNGGFWNGAIAKYLPSVTMKNVKFRVDQEAREEIAAGRKKAPMGSADGQFVRSDNPNFDGIELRFNPKREHLFIDAMGRAVKYADEVTVMGDRMYARGHVEYFGDEDFIGPAGPSPTGAKALAEEEAARQLEPGLLQAVQESAGTGKPLPPPIQESLFAQGTVGPRTQAGNDAMEILSGMGRFVEAPEPGYVAQVRQAWDNARDNPKLAKEQSLGTFRRYADQVETWAFSSDAALNNQIRREIMNSMRGQEEKIGILLNASLSQTAHSDAVANLFLMKGNIEWDKELHKWKGVDDKNNAINLSAKLDEIAAKHGLTKEEIELIAHTAFEAKRTRSLIQFNQELEAKAEAMRAEAARVRDRSPVAASELSDKASRMLQDRKVIHMTPEEIQAGMTQFQLFPELNGVVDIWNGMRENALKVMTDTGLYSRTEAENLLANADYVPFYREDQIEEGKGPKEFLRSLSVQADKRLKGSKKPVNDIFDNMIRWTQYAINRGVRNRSALSLIDTATEVGLAQQVKGPKDGDNVVRVWRDGKEEYHSMADPMFVSAFRGLESVAIPTVKFFSKFADILRQSVVLYPLFGLAQVPQDSFAAMFSSGLKPQYALRIPVLAAIEFVQTLRGKSKAHEDLKNIGAAGVRDFTSSVIRNEFEIMSGLKADKSLWGAVKRGLGNVAMAADNAVRQATYEAALSQGLSQAEAMEKAFEIFNVRRRGNSKALAIAGQVIPFFNAYLAAQHVAYRTLTGVGTSPTQREAAFKTLAATTGSVMALSILYAMMMGDDEGYEKKATPTRDRMLIIPGTNGLGIPLRADLFALPKVLAEHTYHLLTENGMTDGAKFRESMKSLLANAVFSPTPVPQAVKPLAEIIFNYDFFQQRPLVGVFQQQKDLSRQFEDSTSEFSKVLGKSEMISPIMADHFIRGMFGSFGGLFLYMTNPMLAAMAGTTRPSVSMQDAIATIPNASAFVSKEYEVGLRKDFYALKEVTDRAAATLSDLKNRSPQEIADYLEDPKVQQRIALSPAVNRIANQLTQIRKQINFLTSAEAPSLTSSEKENQIRQLREAEYQLLKNINLRKLREMAQV